MKEVIKLKNDVFRVVGRQAGLWGWRLAERGANLVAPWYIGSAFARNTHPTISAIQGTVRDYADRATNFWPVRWAKRLYQGLDWGVNQTIAFTDRTLNRLDGVLPGYRLLTGFPLFLGNWEHKYKQLKNYFVINTLWQHTAAPILKTQVWDKFSVLFSSYAAPYADVMLRYADEKMTRVLAYNFTGGADFGLHALQNSFAARWFQWIRGNGLTPLTSNAQKIIDGVYIQSAGIEALAEHHIESLTNAAGYVVQGVNKLNEMGGEICGYASGLVKDVLRYRNCVVNSDKGFLTCTQSAFNQTMSDYVKPAYNIIYENGLKQTLDFLNTNAFTAPFAGFVYGMMNDVTRYYNCVAHTDKGLGVCTQSAISEIGANYVAPTLRAAMKATVDVSVFLWKNTLQVMLNKGAGLAGEAAEVCAPYKYQIGAGAVVFGLAAFGAKQLYNRVVHPAGAVVVNNHNVQQPAVVPGINP
jgi:hypothetical protein